MSRLEKKIHKKLKRRKIKVVFKVLFILAMITNLSICIFIIDKSAKDMLGTDAYLLNSFIDDINMDDIKVNIGEKINEIYKAKDKIIKLYNVCDVFNINFTIWQDYHIEWQELDFIGFTHIYGTDVIEKKIAIIKIIDENELKMNGIILKSLKKICTKTIYVYQIKFEKIM